MTHYFTLIGKKDKETNVSKVSVDVVGLREKIVNEEEFKKRKIATTFNMFFNKGHKDIVYIAPNHSLIKDPIKLYDIEDADATVFRFEKILEVKPRKIAAVWDVAPQSYIMDNVIMIRNPQFAKDWLAMTAKPFFKNYNNNEMDVLNMLCYYGYYKVRIRDISEL